MVSEAPAKASELTDLLDHTLRDLGPLAAINLPAEAGELTKVRQLLMHVDRPDIRKQWHHTEHFYQFSRVEVLETQTHCMASDNRPLLELIIRKRTEGFVQLCQNLEGELNRANPNGRFVLLGLLETVGAEVVPDIVRVYIDVAWGEVE